MAHTLSIPRQSDVQTCFLSHGHRPSNPLRRDLVLILGCRLSLSLSFPPMVCAHTDSPLSGDSDSTARLTCRRAETSRECHRRVPPESARARFPSLCSVHRSLMCLSHGESNIRSFRVIMKASRARSLTRSARTVAQPHLFVGEEIKLLDTAVSAPTNWPRRLLARGTCLSAGRGRHDVRALARVAIGSLRGPHVDHARASLALPDDDAQALRTPTLLAERDGLPARSAERARSRTDPQEAARPGVATRGRCGCRV